MRVFHVCPILLEPGSVILPGNFGRILNLLGTGHSLFERELILERMRQNYFPQKPSRLTSAFYCEDIESAKWFWHHHSSTSSIYLVEILDEERPIHRGHMNCFPPKKGFLDIEVARRYWVGDLKFNLDTEPNFFPVEYVSETRLRICEKIH